MDAVNIVTDFVSRAKPLWPNERHVGSPTIDSNLQRPNGKDASLPAIDSYAPAGKRQLWTFGSGQANIAKIYFGKTEWVLWAAFGQPTSRKTYGTYFVYTYDKIRVRGPQNMQYSRVYFFVKPDPLGSGKVVDVRLDTASGLPI